MINRESVYFPALSVGSALSTIKKNNKHPVTSKSYRFYTKEEDPVFYYPYLLTSAAHNYKDMDFRNSIGFGKEGKFFGDSGGFQILTGKTDKKFSVELSFDWMEKNCDIFPLLDRPFPKNYQAMKNQDFIDAAEFTQKNAKYFIDKRSKSGNIILNVLQGRDTAEIERWYSYMKDFKFEGWAYGGYNLPQIMAAFFFLFEQKEIDRIQWFHVFMMSRSRYIIYLAYLQYLLNQEDYDLTISYDSSYPIIQVAYGRYALFSTISGNRWITFGNKADYSKTNMDENIPCDDTCCQGIKYSDFLDFTSDKFYAITTFHNIKKFIQYKTNVERVIQLGSPDIYETVFLPDDIKILKVISKAFENRHVPGNYKKVYNDLRVFVDNELETSNSSMGDLF